MAVLLLGATPISIYNSSSPEQIRYLAGHARAAVAIVEHRDFLDRLLEVRADLPDLRHIVAIEPLDATRVESWDELLGAAPLDLETAVDDARPDDLATVIYTSGTTGPPKGVMLDHHNICWTVDSLREALGFSPDRSRIISYLPMAHIAERVVTHYSGIAFALRSDDVRRHPSARRDARRDETADPLRRAAHVREDPQHGAGGARGRPGPRRGVRAGARGRRAGRRAPRPRRGAVGRARGRVREGRRRVAAPGPPAARPRRPAGRGHGGGADPGRGPPVLPRAGVPLSELYGLSESTGPMAWDPVRVQPGTVGRAIPGMELRLADDGEVLGRGGNIFRGYLDDPERTAEALDADGWLHTGDIGQIDDDGYLRIVDRKKELIITAGGKNISPANLEAALKAQPLIGQACVVGEARPTWPRCSCSTPTSSPRGPRATVPPGRRWRSSRSTRRAGRGRTRGRGGQRAVLARRVDPEVHGADRRVAPRLRGAHPDDEAQAPRDRGEVHAARSPSSTTLAGQADRRSRRGRVRGPTARACSSARRPGRRARRRRARGWGGTRSPPTRSASRRPGSLRNASRTRSATIERPGSRCRRAPRPRRRRPGGTPRRSRGACATPPRRARSAPARRGLLGAVEPVELPEHHRDRLHLAPGGGDHLLEQHREMALAEETRDRVDLPVARCRYREEDRPRRVPRPRPGSAPRRPRPAALSSSRRSRRACARASHRESSARVRRTSTSAPTPAAATQPPPRRDRAPPRRRPPR